MRGAGRKLQKKLRLSATRLGSRNSEPYCQNESTPTQWVSAVDDGLFCIGFCISWLCSGASRADRGPPSGPLSPRGPRRPPAEQQQRHAPTPGAPRATPGGTGASGRTDTNQPSTDSRTHDANGQRHAAEPTPQPTNTRTDQSDKQTRHTSRGKPANRNNRRHATETPPRNTQSTPPQSRPAVSAAMCSLDGGGIMHKCVGGHLLEPPTAHFS